MKTCSSCDRFKPYSEFNKNKTRPDGLQPYCRECGKETNKEWRLKNKERAAAYDKARRGLIKRKEYNKTYNLEYLPKWREEHPEYNRNYNIENAESRRQYQRAYRERKKAAVVG